MLLTAVIATLAVAADCSAAVVIRAVLPAAGETIADGQDIDLLSTLESSSSLGGASDLVVLFEGGALLDTSTTWRLGGFGLSGLTGMFRDMLDVHSVAAIEADGSALATETYRNMGNTALLRLTIDPLPALSGVAGLRFHDVFKFAPDLSLLTVLSPAQFIGSGGANVQQQPPPTPPILHSPEPGTLAMWGLGVVGLIGLGYRRRHARRQSAARR